MRGSWEHNDRGMLGVSFESDVNLGKVFRQPCGPRNGRTVLSELISPLLLGYGTRDRYEMVGKSKLKP